MSDMLQTIDSWRRDRAERLERPAPVVRRTGYDTAVTDTHIVDPAWQAARRRAAELMGEGR